MKANASPSLPWKMIKYLSPGNHCSLGQSLSVEAVTGVTLAVLSACHTISITAFGVVSQTSEMHRHRTERRTEN